MDRDTAIKLLSENEYNSIDAEAKISIVVSYWHSFENNIFDKNLVNYLKENEPEDTEYYDPIFKELVIFGLTVQNSYFNNIYLSSKLSDLLDEHVTVEGDERQGKIRCPLCQFFTLTERLDYDICRICKWEDDGTEIIDINRYSSCNHDFFQAYQHRFLTTANMEQLHQKYIY